MIDLTWEFEDFIEYNGGRIKLCLEFKNVLRAFEILNDESLAFPVRAVAGVNLLAPGSNLLVGQRIEVIGLILGYIKELAGLCASYGHGKSPVKILDFKKDAAAIYAAFYGAYNIDLFDSRMHFVKFLMLINNVPRNTRLYEIMAIRSSREPGLSRLREVYALDMDEAGRQEHLDNCLKAIFGAIKPGS